MKIIISPAKRFIKSNYLAKENLLFLEESKYLVERLRKYTISEIANIFKVNDEIAIKTYYDYKEFDFNDLKNPAFFSFDGLVYKQFSNKYFNDLDYLNSHVFIIDALFGLLKPFTGIRDYRLDMNTFGAKLYKFWADKIYREIYKEHDTIINLASDEFSKLVYKYLSYEDIFIDISFLDFKNGKYKITPTWAKEQRGRMLFYIISNKIENVEELINYTNDGYKYNLSLSNNKKMVFSRN
ncbi:MAG: YaaA family protein [Peptoniphilaceae bacterium]|nr:YaaA family protein [Peptoniphilaceae bacterium]MDD7383020.1 YaaA family protein [Peptoniphilaceae bacterium]MDY3737771.1 YaaA family protein [Peptoniphilaceae bacterium]